MSCDLTPHQEPFLFIDEVLSCEGTLVVATRLFRAEEDFFRGHFPGRPIVPGVILIEGMTQTLALWAKAQPSAPRICLVGVDRARFRKPVLPGDTVVFEVSVDARDADTITARATASVGEARVADAILRARWA